MLGFMCETLYTKAQGALLVGTAQAQGLRTGENRCLGRRVACVAQKFLPVLQDHLNHPPGSVGTLVDLIKACIAILTKKMLLPTVFERKKE